MGFAPESSGAHGGDLFVSDVGSGKLYVIDAAGDATLFADLPLPIGFAQPGLRQFAWAPAGFTLPDGQDLGGDLFVSIAAQNGGGARTARSTSSTGRATRSRTTSRAAAPRRSIHADCCS
ncbi:MAG TPA: hypothetical protein VN637_04100 [Roseiarcus sp.]|nr:hypothetical protein [Roseiarcus sp.]